MKRISILLLALVMAFSLVACGAPAAPSAPGSAEAPAAPESPATDPGQAAWSQPFVCIVSESPEGAPFSQLTWKGFEKIAGETGAKIQFVEALEPAEIEEQLRSMAKLGANPIYSMFDGVNQVSAKIAPEYPDTHFILIDSNQTFDIANVTNIVVDSFEPSFVAGVVAAMSSESGTVGWVGSIDIPVIVRFYDGFVAGINYANQTFGLNVKAEKAFVGDDADTVKGAETAKILMGKGADIIYHAANEAGLGVIQACVEANKKAIGVDKWQGDVDPLVFWSALIAIDDAVFDSYTRFTGGTLEAGAIDYGVSTGSPIYDDRDYANLPEDVKKAVDDVMAGIREGKIDVFSYQQS